MEIKLRGWKPPDKRLLLWALGLFDSCKNRGDGAGERTSCGRLHPLWGKTSEPRTGVDSICYTFWRLTGLLNLGSFQRRYMNNSPSLHLSLSDILQEFKPIILKGTPIQREIKKPISLLLNQAPTPGITRLNLSGEPSSGLPSALN